MLAPFFHEQTSSAQTSCPSIWNMNSMLTLTPFQKISQQKEPSLQPSPLPLVKQSLTSPAQESIPSIQETTLPLVRCTRTGWIICPQQCLSPMLGPTLEIWVPPNGFQYWVIVSSANYQVLTAIIGQYGVIPHIGCQFRVNIVDIGFNTGSHPILYPMFNTGSHSILYPIQGTHIECWPQLECPIWGWTHLGWVLTNLGWFPAIWGKPQMELNPCG